MYFYIEKFKELDIPYQSFNVEPPNCSIGAWMTTVVLDSPSASSKLSENLRLDLQRNGIDARPFFAPLSSTPPFKHLANRRTYSTWADRIPPVAINLPSSHDISQADIGFVCSEIKKVLS